MSENTPDETFRGAMRSCSSEGEPHTMNVTQQGLGNAGRVWLTFNGAIRTTVVMTNPEAAQLCELLNKATTTRRRKPGTVL